jgi:hypothetical protein
VSEPVMSFKVQGETWNRQTKADIVFSALGHDLAVDISTFVYAFNKRFMDREMTPDQEKMFREIRVLIEEHFRHLSIVQSLVE